MPGMLGIFMNYCTLFNSGYLTRGWTMIKSLLRHAPQAKIYILCMDEKTFDFFSKRQHPSIYLVSLKDFEDSRYLAAKSNRSFGEYCWTCTPGIINYCLKTFHLDHVTYVDADLYFLGNPEKCLQEWTE